MNQRMSGIVTGGRAWCPSAGYRRVLRYPPLLNYAPFDPPGQIRVNDTTLSGNWVKIGSP
jgi:hypothetical protein